MSSDVHRFYIDLEVRNLQELAAAARKRAMTDGLTSKQAAEYLMGGDEPCISACLVMLLDPGESPDGTRIISSGVE